MSKIPKKMVLIEIDATVYTKYAFQAWKLRRQIPQIIEAAVNEYSQRINIDTEEFDEFDAI